MEIAKESKIAGCFLLKPKIFNDERGTLVKPFHSSDFQDLGLHSGFKEELVVTSKKGVVRGLHFQLPPLSQVKLISCAKGKILDVLLDIRKGSPTYGQWDSFILDNENNYALYVPEGIAQGYAVYEENSIVIYRISKTFSQELDSGIKWDSVGIEWGIENPIVSQKDTNLIPFSRFDSMFTYND